MCPIFLSTHACTQLSLVQGRGKTAAQFKDMVVVRTKHRDMDVCLEIWINALDMRLLARDQEILRKPEQNYGNILAWPPFFSITLVRS